MAAWHPPGRARERWLVYGDTWTGKTVGALEIARKVPGKVYVVDTDAAYPMILERAYGDLENVELFAANEEWPQSAAMIEKAFRVAGPDDWVVLDGMSDLWDQCIDYHAELLTGTDLPAFLIGFRERVGQDKAKRQGVQGALVEDGLYDYVNPAWRKAVINRTKTTKCHLYMTAQSGATGNPKEDALTKQTYGNFGFKPRTQKAVGFNAATIILLTKDKMGKRSYSEVKNWGRATGARDVEYESLAMDYLFKVAGWRPHRGGGDGDGDDDSN